MFFHKMQKKLKENVTLAALFNHNSYRVFVLRLLCLTFRYHFFFYSGTIKDLHCIIITAKNLERNNN